MQPSNEMPRFLSTGAAPSRTSAKVNADGGLRVHELTGKKLCLPRLGTPWTAGDEDDPGNPGT